MSLPFLFLAGAAFLASLYYGQKARTAGDPEATRKALNISLPLLIAGFIFLYLGWGGGMTAR